MSITDELRKEARGFGRYVYTAPQADCLTAIADRIDAEHEAKVSYWQEASYKDGYDEGFASADDWLAQHEDAMAEHGWYRSLCADRKPMLLGDRMEWANGTFTIRELKFTEDGCTTWDSEHGYTVHANECRHHHEPTVEDVLREFAYGLGVPVADSYIAASAAKLRLAGDAE